MRRSTTNVLLALGLISTVTFVGANPAAAYGTKQRVAPSGASVGFGTICTDSSAQVGIYGFPVDQTEVTLRLTINGKFVYDDTVELSRGRAVNEYYLGGGFAGAGARMRLRFHTDLSTKAHPDRGYAEGIVQAGC